MGTNYYFYEHICEHCGRGDEPRHIGKSSAGWCFGLHVYPDEGINTLADWRKLWAGDGAIKDEYGTIISMDAMLDIITNRRWGKPKYPNYSYASEDDFHKANHSEPGPNNLARHKIDGQHCIGHGKGTWDYEVGEFC